ncbi:phosphoribosylanthranilate isomerase [Taibaiella helva]|uniref:phosphoribosylanthranilate isomerase n=1 Tax=Taibaiella helva TaxID=2301235 RepID=UPI000E57AB3F|nr:phosphoribosylanthranilate isomerase [Taibaiella helva]
MKIKVCGLTGTYNMEAVAGLGVNRCGLIFYPSSQRYAGRNAALQARCAAAPFPGLTGVFVNQDETYIREITAAFRLSFIQLHGTEQPAFCARINAIRPVIKAFAMHEQFNFDRLKRYQHSCNAFLFDTPGSSHGGTGRTFNWSLLQDKDIPLPFWLAGGIGPGDVAKVKAFHHPAFTGIDLNSRFESSAGVKDITLLKAFINDLRKSI